VRVPQQDGAERGESLVSWEAAVMCMRDRAELAREEDGRQELTSVKDHAQDHTVRR
jgi:hypothetical protein